MDEDEPKKYIGRYTLDELTGERYRKSRRNHLLLIAGLLVWLLVFSALEDAYPDYERAIMIVELIGYIAGLMWVFRWLAKSNFKRAVCKVLARRMLGLKYSDHIAVLTGLDPFVVTAIFNGDYDALESEPETLKYSC